MRCIIGAHCNSGKVLEITAQVGEFAHTKGICHKSGLYEKWEEERHCFWLIFPRDKKMISDGWEEG